MGGNGDKRATGRDALKAVRSTGLSEQDKTGFRFRVVSDSLERVLAEIEREAGEGVVHQVIGPVVDVVFTGKMPALRSLLRIDDRTHGLPLEAVQLLGERPRALRRPRLHGWAAAGSARIRHVRADLDPRRT
jgi:hypothetical protein